VDRVGDPRRGCGRSSIVTAARSLEALRDFACRRLLSFLLAFFPLAPILHSYLAGSDFPQTDASLYDGREIVRCRTLLLDIGSNLQGLASMGPISWSWT
jgi:hypothetical protein